MDVLGSANEPHGGHSKTMCVQCILGGLYDVWMRGQSQIIIGAKIYYLFPGRNFDNRVLRGNDDSFLFEKAIFLYLL